MSKIQWARRKKSLHRNFVVAIISVVLLFGLSMRYAGSTIAAAVLAAGIPFTYHIFRIYSDSPKIDSVDQGGSKLFVGDISKQRVLPMIRLSIEVENYGRRTAKNCYAKYDSGTEKTYTRWHLLNQQYVDLHPRDERHIILGRLIPTRDTIDDIKSYLGEEWKTETEIRNLDRFPTEIRDLDDFPLFKKDTTVTIRGSHFYVDCPLQEEIEDRVRERQDSPLSKDLYLGRRFPIGIYLDGTLEFGAEDFTDDVNVNLKLNQIHSAASWREDHQSEIPELANAFDKVLKTQDIHNS